jgi:hypothetical protein
MTGTKKIAMLGGAAALAFAGGAPDAAPAVDYERCAATADRHQAGVVDRWRIEGRMCELERALKAGESVVLSGSELARAGLPYGGEGRARERLYLLDEFDQIREYFGDV